MKRVELASTLRDALSRASLSSWGGLRLATLGTGSVWIAALLWQVDLRDREHEVASEWAAVTAGSQASPSVDTPVLGTEADFDFTAALPERVDLQRLLAWSQQACARSGLKLQGVQVSERSASREVLSRSGLNLSLTGDYVRLKVAIAEIFAHIPNATLEQWTIRRRPGGGEVDATVRLIVWGKSQVREPPALAR